MTMYYTSLGEHTKAETKCPSFCSGISKCIVFHETVSISLKISLKIFLRYQLSILQHWSRQWLGAVQATSHYLNQWWLVCWRIYASRGLTGLKIQLPLMISYCPLYHTQFSKEFDEILADWLTLWALLKPLMVRKISLNVSLSVNISRIMLCMVSCQLNLFWYFLICKSALNATRLLLVDMYYVYIINFGQKQDNQGRSRQGRP